MADGRKNNKGTKGNKGGRPPKADELKKIDLMDSVLIPREAWEALANKVKEGDTQAIKEWIAHRYGKPKELKEHAVRGNMNFEGIIIDEPTE